ncbi:hypothetical protein CKA32_002664 [Geitlerinema sp. FC II]|nr:hypothetical protein [Geitlerinema sp. CS-897]PPT10696.1 hypothetical protein CKA32_002664 [Geitlerinema sp. FC II]
MNGVRRLAALMWVRGLSVGAVRDAGISFDGGRRHFCPRVTAPYGCSSVGNRNGGCGVCRWAWCVTRERHLTVGGGIFAPASQHPTGFVSVTIKTQKCQ